MSEGGQLLASLATGKRKAGRDLIPVVYDELRRLAAYRLAHENPGQTLQATALVHEAYLRLLHVGCDHWEDSRHFFNAAAEAMRRILIDNARRKDCAKHGGHLKRADLDERDLPTATQPDDLLALDEVLREFEQTHPAEAQLVKLRYFVGMTQEEAARILGISRRTVNNRWAFARAWLYQALHPDEAVPPSSKEVCTKNDGFSQP
jgi:RNA polymerase sigma factor (TIGR02999 family)